MLSLAVTRASLSLADLAIDDTGFNAYSITPDGFSEPETAPRVVTARSPFVHGDLVTGYVLNTGTMALEVWVQGTTTAILETRVAALRRALCMQRSYTIVRTLDGQAQTWSCQPAGMTPAGPIRKGEVARFERTYRITVPVYPIFGS